MMDEIDKKIRENVPPDLRARVMHKASPVLDRNRERELGTNTGFWTWIFRPQALGGLAAAALGVLVILHFQSKREAEPTVAQSPVQFDLEMLAEAELLQDLDVLDQWEKLKPAQNEKWKKKKS